MSEFQSGGGESVQIGSVNKNLQECHGHRRRKGNHSNQYVYKMECQVCRHTYGANGCDVHERLCPFCQKGSPGIDF